MENIIERSWTTKSGLEAEVVFDIFNGFRCGYVYIPESHELSGKEYWEMYHLDVHGGVTYANPNDDSNYNWKIGFDCGHYIDKNDYSEWKMYLAELGIPEDKAKDIMDYPYLDLPGDEGEIRSKDYVVEQCELLAQQLV